MNPYEVLDVAPSATLAEIESRYRELLLVHHPDLHAQEGPAAVARAGRTTRELTAAMAMLRRQHPPGGVRVRPTSSTPPGPGPGPGDPRADEPWDAPFSWDPPPPRPGRVYTCPLCGTVLATLPEFEGHCADVHDIHLDAPPKGKSRRSRSGAGRGLALRFAGFLVSIALTVVVLQWASTQMRIYGTFLYALGLGVAAWVVVLAWLFLGTGRKRTHRR